MKVLIATAELQDTVPGDFSRTLEGELVTAVATECDDEQCCCARGFPGLVSGGSTTTAMVVERSRLTIDDVRDAVTGFIERSGWVELLTDATDQAADPEQAIGLGIAELVDEHVEMILEVGARFREGTVVARSGTAIYERAIRQAA
ncbi:MAG: hypothetical protein AAGF73_06275 [Actinomycetota bacterium]